MDKKKILFVVYDFFQAGAERFVYEIDRALDKNRYEITLLCLHSEQYKDDIWKNPYYFEKHKQLGSEIVFFDNYTPSMLVINRVIRKIKREIYEKPCRDYSSKLIPFLCKFDLIHWIGEYSYLSQLPLKITEKSLISSMSAKFQNPKLYSKFDFDLPYNFADGFSSEERDYEYSEFKDTKHWYIPLLLKAPFMTNKWKFVNSCKKKIGIFTRLDRYKPLDPFFYAFHLLLDELPNSELHIFGNGDPEKEGMTRYLKTLNISDKVFFRGHQEDIAQTAINEHIDLSWFQGYNNNRPAGYAGFDVCSTGTPLLCWDFLDNPTNPFNEVYPHYKNIGLFVKKSIEVLTDETTAKGLSNRQFNDVIENRDIEKNIYLIENAYNSILNHK